MKVKVLLFLGLLALVPTLKAASFGLEGGVSMAQNKQEPANGFTFSNRTGVAGGLFVDFALSKWLSIGPEVLYVQKGSKVNVLSIEAKYLFDYVDVPLLLKVRLGGQSVSFTLFGGVAYGFVTNAKTEVLGVTTDVSSSLKKNDLSAHAGAALGFMMGKGTEFFLAARYILGIQDIEDDGDATDKVKNNAIVSLVGLKFGLGKN